MNKQATNGFYAKPASEKKPRRAKSIPKKPARKSEQWSDKKLRRFYGWVDPRG